MVRNCFSVLFFYRSTMEGRRSKRNAGLMKSGRKSGDWFHDLEQQSLETLKKAKAKKKGKGAEKRVSAPDDNNNNNNDDDKKKKKRGKKVNNQQKTFTTRKEEEEEEEVDSDSTESILSIEAQREPPTLQEVDLEAVVVETAALSTQEEDEEEDKEEEDKEDKEEKGEMNLPPPLDLGLISPSRVVEIPWRPLSPVVVVQRSRPRLNNTTMASDGILSIRFDHNKKHWPVEAPTYGSRNPKCQLHRYICEIDVRRNVVDCSICGVALCPQCFKLFHTRSDFIVNKVKYREALTKAWRKSHPPKSENT